MRWKMTLRVISVWLFISFVHPSAKGVFGSNRKQIAACTGNERQLTIPMVFMHSRSGAIDLGPFNKNASPCFRCAKETLIFEKEGLFLPQSCHKHHFRGLVSQRQWTGKLPYAWTMRKPVCSRVSPTKWAPCCPADEWFQQFLCWQVMFSPYLFSVRDDLGVGGISCGW